MPDLRFNRSSTNKQEEEVDHLTDLLVKSMESSVEPDFFGTVFHFNLKLIIYFKKISPNPLKNTILNPIQQHVCLFLVNICLQKILTLSELVFLLANLVVISSVCTFRVVSV